MNLRFISILSSSSFVFFLYVLIVDLSSFFHVLLLSDLSF